MRTDDYNTYLSDPKGEVLMGSKECVQVKTLDQALNYLRVKLGVEKFTNVDIKCNGMAPKTFQITVTKGQF